MNLLKRIWSVIRKSRKTQVLMVLFAVAATADAGFFLLMASPAAGDVAELKYEIELTGRELSELDRQVMMYESFIEGKDDLDTFKEMLPSRAEYVGLLEDVYELARKDRMVGSSFGASVSPLSKSSGFEQVNFSLPASGSYRDVRKFIYDVETSDMFLNINSLGLNKGAGDVISLSIGISTYVR